jgi:hypothetical protein
VDDDERGQDRLTLDDGVVVQVYSKAGHDPVLRVQMFQHASKFQGGRPACCQDGTGLCLALLIEALLKLLSRHGIEGQGHAYILGGALERVEQFPRQAHLGRGDQPGGAEGKHQEGENQGEGGAKQRAAEGSPGKGPGILEPGQPEKSCLTLTASLGTDSLDHALPTGVHCSSVG